MSIIIKSGDSSDLAQVTPAKELLVKINSATLGAMLVGIDYAHYQVHSGQHFMGGDLGTISNNGNVDYLFISDNTYNCHFLFDIASDQNIKIEIYEAPTITANGTVLGTINLNRTKTNVPTALVYKNPTITANGNMLGAMYSIGRGAPANNNQEMIFKKGVKYLCRLVGTVNGTIYSVVFDWYEVTF
jgi:hypothetical protein